MDQADQDSSAPLNETAEEREFYWYSEHLALIITTIKWTILGSLSGIMTGALTRLFLFCLDLSMRGASQLHFGSFNYYYSLPLTLPLSVWLIRRFAPDARGHGTEAVIASVNRRNGLIDWMVAPIKLLSTLLTLAFGGSAGREGPCAQIGAAATSVLASRLHLSDKDRRCLVICGISGGFASVFGTPLSGAIFGVEVLHTGIIEYPVLFPSLVAGLAAHLVCNELTPVPQLIPLMTIKAQLGLMPLAILFGILFGLTALLLIEGMRFGKRIGRPLHRHPYWLAGSAGVLLAVYYDIFGDQYAALSYPILHGALDGSKEISLPAVLLKIIATVITLEAGGSGGVINTMFCIGAATGSAVAQIFGIPPAPFAAFGFIAVLGAGANTPVTACLMSLELLPHPYGLYSALSSVTAYLMVGHRSVYSSQRLGTIKSGGLDLPLGLSYDEMQTTAIRIKKGSLTERAHRFRKRKEQAKMQTDVEEIGAASKPAERSESDNSNAPPLPK